MSDLNSTAPERCAQEEFTRFDLVFGDFLFRRARKGEEALRTLGMNLISARRKGDSFIYLSPEQKALLEGHRELTDEEEGLLVQEGHKLYLRREFLNEEAAARAIAGLLKGPTLSADFTDEEIDRACGKNLNDEQHLAVRNALTHSFALISGGPGTGKSTIIAAVAELECRRNPGSIVRIAAPTGKAAELLTGDLKSVLPERGLTASTLHTLFKIRLQTNEFGVNEENPLECNLLIVDECSMVPLNTVANMFRGLRPGTRVVLAGDHRQLESVESGAVLSELLSARETAPESLLARAGVELIENFRSINAPGIQGLARKIREGKPPEELCAELASGSAGDVAFLDERADFLKEMRAAARRCWSELPETASLCSEERVKKAFVRLNSFRVLSANRVGPEGCVELNKMIMKELALPSQYVPGAALMVTQNSSATGLANGDVGIVFAAPGGGVKVFFENFERPFAPHELPPHEGAFATTVHKAQGSGFDEVFFLLPREDSPLLTRELFYTGLTRAKKKITVAGSRKTVTGALGRSSRRRSCLARRIADFLEDGKNGL